MKHKSTAAIKIIIGILIVLCIGAYMIWYANENDNYKTVTVKVNSVAKGSQNNADLVDAMVTYNGKEYEIKEVQKKIFLQGKEAVAYLSKGKLYANTDDITSTNLEKQAYFGVFSPTDRMIPWRRATTKRSLAS